MPLMRLAAATASTSAAPSVVRDVNCYCFFTYATTLPYYFHHFYYYPLVLLSWVDGKEALSSFWEELQQQ